MSDADTTYRSPPRISFSPTASGCESQVPATIGPTPCADLPGLGGTNLAVIETDETTGWLGATRTVTLYIGCNLDSGVTVFRLEGWLEGEAVSELERVAHECAGPIRLDLSGLRSADAAGLNALRALRTTGATLVGASPYIRLLLGS